MTDSLGKNTETTSCDKFCEALACMNSLLEQWKEGLLTEKQVQELLNKEKSKKEQLLLPEHYGILKGVISQTSRFISKKFKPKSKEEQKQSWLYQIKQEATSFLSNAYSFLSSAYFNTCTRVDNWLGINNKKCEDEGISSPVLSELTPVPENLKVVLRPIPQERDNKELNV